jgi:hypothetical protein
VDTTRIEVLRAGKVVCELLAGAGGSHENHSSSSYDQLVVSSRDPLRFHVRETSISNELGPSERCTGFELRDGETCRQLFEHSCSEAACKLTYTTSLAPGAGILRGKINRDNEPVVGGTVQTGSQLAISDEHGGFSIEAGPGVHEIAVASSFHAHAQKASVLIGPDQDAEVSIAITCPCCAPRSAISS